MTNALCSGKINIAVGTAGVAQLVEQLICNQQVGGSNPSTSSKISYGGIPERPNGADCKSVVTDFGGSNPPSPTNKRRQMSAFIFCPEPMASPSPSSRYAGGSAETPNDAVSPRLLHVPDLIDDVPPSACPHSRAEYKLFVIGTRLSQVIC